MSIRALLAGLALVSLPTAGALAQPKLGSNDQPPPRPQLTPAPPSPPVAAAPVAVQPGVEPWYTVFGTGEVIGYIEPCG